MQPLRHPFTATTRTATAWPPSLAVTPVSAGEIITSTESGLHYRIDRLLGHGGFGQVYLARRLGRSAHVPAQVCIKISTRLDGWLREAYFGQVLDGHPRAIRVFEAFPLLRPGARAVYCLSLEYARHGDLSACLTRSAKPWPERTVRREIAGILEVLGKLHRGRMLHRDLTPLNVFVCDGHRLKLGDFGITRHQSDERGITARTMNALTAPSDILDAAVPKWQTRDDVYQVGQLLGMLVKGDARSRIRAADVRHLPCSDQMKEIIYRCIWERRKRYETADELIAALRARPTVLRTGMRKTLRGVHLVFTGILSQPRTAAALAARRAGAIVHSMPSAKTNVVVRGKPNALQAAGKDAGRKLMEIKRLRENGQRITLLNESQFWRLVGGS
jgi:serine/threonine-protein kinase